MIGFGSVLTDDWETAKSQDNLVTESIPTTSYSTLIFNTQKEYLTQEVRQALNMAINRDVLVNGLLMGEGTPIMTPIAPVNPYYNDKVQVQYDPERAKEMLAEAGFPAGQTLKFFISSGSSITERCAALIVQDFANVGVQVQIEQMDLFQSYASLYQSASFRHSASGCEKETPTHHSAGGCAKRLQPAFRM